ncbi:FMN-dependent NADH-azoreductase [Motilibacter rhizosphaerae]|uniref:FMN dependent NADH:quinone oxidoreductase n=1 Tax=Motilibacter rhizosphaerae TaxID=598652 RepID=A0A4Q7NWE6_9ACTN|nr:NAD(P)H-dependent oxidoreductase [Motilibacter rhizosphaerae]RZS91504.1 FMN-dependent NADH-azoreductase [Motilibacter rhizosphaerae]
MTLFRLDASIRGPQSVTRAVADTAEQAYLRSSGDEHVVRRDLGAHPLPSDAWAAAVGARWTPEPEWSDETRSAVRLATSLADEVAAADAYVFALPLYNWGVDAHVKAWLDLLLTDPRFAPGSTPVTTGRPAALVVARGGAYGEGTPKFGWDHATPWYRRVLGDVLGLDLHVSEVELTLAEVNPAMAAFVDQARENARRGHELAEAHGAEVAAKAGTAERLAG